MTDNLLLGTKAFISNSYTLAIKYFTLLIESHKNSERVLGYLYRGTCYLEKGLLIEASKDFQLGLDNNKNSFELNFKLGIVLFKLSEFEEADKVFRQALISSNNSEEREKLLLWQNKTKLEVEVIKEARQKKLGNIKFSQNWYQTNDSVVVTLDCSVHINKDIFGVVIEKRNFYITYEGTKIFEILLSNAVNEKLSTYKLLSQKIEIKLIKDIVSQNWITLDEKSKNDVQKYPTSMKKDFNQINRELERQFKGEGRDLEGNDAAMYLFKEIYATASEETRRAMMKSYATSGGTVLSTNWDEVKKKDYEGADRPEAPEGQEWVDEREKKNKKK